MENLLGSSIDYLSSDKKFHIVVKKKLFSNNAYVLRRYAIDENGSEKLVVKRVIDQPEYHRITNTVRHLRKFDEDLAILDNGSRMMAMIR